MTDLTNLPIPVDPDDPAELISLIPYEFKFQPEESAVFLPVHVDWRGMRLGPLIRVDLPTLATRAAAARLRRRFEASLARGSWHAHIVIFTGALYGALATRDLQPPALEARADAISRELARWYDLPQFHPTRTYIVGSQEWRCLACREPAHCPPAGHPCSGLGHTCIATWMSQRGQEYASSREALFDLPDQPPPAALDHRVERELRRLHRHRTDPRPLAWQEVMTRKWREVLGRGAGATGGPPAPADLSLLALSLHSIPIRDNIIYAICTGDPLPSPRTDEAHFAAMFRQRSQPDSVAMTTALELLERLARHCPAPFRAPILTVWAWCHWWYGQGAQANLLVDLALECDPGYSLALTLQRVLDSAMVPPWARGSGPAGG